MGTYIYRRTGKTVRATAPDGSTIKATKLVFFHAERQTPSYISMLESRLKKLWADTDPPRYVTHGDPMKHTCHVYGGWMKGQVTVGEDFSRCLFVEGVIRGNTFSPWWSILVMKDVFASTHDAIRDLVPSRDWSERFLWAVAPLYLPPCYSNVAVRTADTAILYGEDENVRIALTLLLGEGIVQPEVQEVT